MVQLVHPELDQCERYFIGGGGKDALEGTGGQPCTALRSRKKKDHAAVIQEAEEKAFSNQPF